MLKPTRPYVLSFAFCVLSFLPALALAQETKPAPQPKLDDQVALLKSMQKYFVAVDYELQYDKGEAPRSTGYSDDGDHPESLEELIRQERPLEKTGILLSDTSVVSIDPQINPRFIKKITIHSLDGSQLISGPINISAYPKDQNAVILSSPVELLRSAPTNFDTKKPGPYSIASTVFADGEWVFALKPLGTDLTLTPTRKLISSTAGLIIDAKGTPVGVSMGGDLLADGSWKGNPTDWPAVSSKDISAALQSLDSSTAQNIVRVSLNFRSPKNLDQQTLYRQESDPSSAAEQQVLGVLLDNKTVLILAEYKPKVTARLERIKVFTNPPIEAKFKASLTDYGAFLAELDKPADAPIKLSTQDMNPLIDSIIKSADIVMQGEKRVAHFQPARFSGLSVGWRKNLYPDLLGATLPLFLFDQDNALLALPIARRQKASVEERYEQNAPVTTPITQITATLANLPAATDPSNIPLSEEQENRLAWLGFELQAMNKELARANNVSDQTNDGESGALVTYVYPDSPAAKAGIEAGWIFLRVEAQGQPKPIDVKIDNSADPFADHPFPWARLGEAPEAVFDKIPTPWPHVENSLIRTITDLGFGKTFTAVFFHDGQLERKDFTIVEGPRYFQNAPKYKLDSLGVTVKDITYEVRRYMQKKTDEPGVVISKIEMGSKASSSGLKPYEVITHVNDKPVMNVQDFENLTKGQTELRLSVKRMTIGRIVKIDLTPTPNTQPDTPSP